MKKMKIAVDFDGVLHRYSKGWNGGEIYDEPVKGAREAIEHLKSEGHTVYIFSTRTNPLFRKKNKDGEPQNIPDQKKAMESWLSKHNIPYDKVWTFGKPMVDLFIDDRAIGFSGDWAKTLEAVKSFSPWYKT